MLKLSRWKVTLVALATVFGLLFAAPNVLPQRALDAMPNWLPKQKLNLGLDLQGGSYLLLEVDLAALRAERLNNMVEDVRTTLRDQQIQFTGLAQQNGAVVVRINDQAQLNKAANALRGAVGAAATGPGAVRDTLVDTLPDQRVQISFAPEGVKAEGQRAVEQSIEIIRRRIDQLGTKEPAINRQGTNRIVVQAAGESDPERLKNLIGQTAKLTFQMVDETVTPEQLASGRLPPGTALLPYDQNPPLAVKKRAVVTGEMLTNAQQAFDQQSGQAVVNFRFNGEGTRKFGDATTRNVGKRFAIVLDNKIITAPVINGPIPGGSGQITGNFTAQSANDLAVLLRAGALPAPLKVQEQRTVGAELGADAVRAGTISIAIGFVAIVVFMLLAYGGLFGGTAILALFLNVILLIAILSLTQATLTLPGIAGMILTLAVAVDANVLVYERMRDEERGGRGPLAAMETGFSRALVSIIDANVTSLISALILFQFGTGVVKGFAWTLSVGVFTSLFTAILVTQVLLGLWFRAARPKTLPI